MKALRRSVLIIVALVIVALGAAYFVRNGMVRSALEGASERSLGVETSLASVRLDLMGQSFSMADYRAANPDGFDDDAFLSLGRGHIEVDGGTVFSDEIRIPALELEEVRLNLIQKAAEGNYEAILDNVRGTRSETTGATGNGGRRIVLENVRIRDVLITAHVEIPGSDPIHEEISLGELQLQGVSSDDGVPLDQLIARLVQGLIEAGLEESGGRLPDRVMAGVRERLGNLPSVESLEAGARAAADSAKKSLADEALDAAGELLGRGSDDNEGNER